MRSLSINMWIKPTHWATMAFLCLAVPTMTQAQTRPTAPDSLAFDFLLGKWEGEPGTGFYATKVFAEAIVETWDEEFFDAVVTRFWDGATWSLTFLAPGMEPQSWEGRREDDAWRFYREWMLDGQTVHSRTWWRQLPDSSGHRVERVVEQSRDKGATWTTHVRAKYRKKSTDFEQAVDLQAVAAADMAYATAWLSNDPDKVMATLAEDAVIMPSGLRSIRGAQAIRAFWWPPEGSTTTVTRFELQHDDVSATGDAGFVRGRFTLEFVSDGSDYKSSGEYLSVLTKVVDGSFRIATRVWNDLKRNVE